MSIIETDWPFPSVRVHIIGVPNKGYFLELSGSEELIKSYLERFGCVPVFDVETIVPDGIPKPPRFNREFFNSKKLRESNSASAFDSKPRYRKIARRNKDGRWEISDLDGSTELETHPRVVRNVSNQLQLLTTHTWCHIGYNVQPKIIEFDFRKDGEGYSRYASWGHGTTVPKVQDYYWRFSIKENSMNIEWEDEGNTQIGFVLTKELRAASSLSGSGLAFYDMTLKVDAPLFPPSADFGQYLLKEYWGQLKTSEENE